MTQNFSFRPRFKPIFGLGDLIVVCAIIGAAAVLVWRVDMLERVQEKQEARIIAMDTENNRAHLELARALAAIAFPSRTGH